MSGHATVRVGPKASTAVARRMAADPAAWRRRYVHRAFAVDGACALAAGLAAFVIRFQDPASVAVPHVILTVSLPLLWWVSVALARGYDVRFIGLGSEEFRRVLNAAVSLTGAVAIVSYAARSDIARGYLVIALPCATVLDLLARFVLRKRLHRQRRAGAFMHRTIAVGSADAVADLIAELRRETYHGLSVVGACLSVAAPPAEVAGVPVCGGLRADPGRRFGPGRGHGGRAGLSRAGRCPAPQSRLAAGEDGHRPVRGPCRHGRGRTADDHPPGGRAAAAARGSPRARRGRARSSRACSTRWSR